MRRHGALGTASDFGIHDHGCWLYRGDAELRHAVVEYLSDGRRLGQRLVYVGGKPEIGLRADLDGLEDVEPLLRDGGLRVVPIPELYRPGEPIDAETVLDLSRLEFIDHHGLLALADHARSFNGGSAGMAIRGAPFWVRRLCQLIDVEL